MFLLDKITDLACFRAKKYAEAGADILMLGDDLGTQNSIMLSAEMCRDWLKPRLCRVIAAAKAAKPDVIIQYHSCAYVLPLIGDLIEAGIDVLNPVQPECMDVEHVLCEFGGRVSFNGTIGTQTTMPFGTPADAAQLGTCRCAWWVFCCPTHMLEP